MKTLNEILVRHEINKLADLEGPALLSVTFIKRTSGEERVLNGVLSSKIKNGKTGEGLKFDPSAYDLCPVVDFAAIRKNKAKGLDPYDAVKRSFRSFPVDSVTRLAVNGKIYDAKEEVR